MKINEIFYSISGESINSGYPTIFIRTFGCIKPYCNYCDSMYAVEGNDYTEMSVPEIISKVKEYLPCKRIILTGGEPLIQKDWKSLVLNLVNEDYIVEIETNGAVIIDSQIPVTYTVDWKSPSSGMNSLMKVENLYNMLPGDNLKFVVGTKEDLEECKRVYSKYPLNGINIFLSPIFGKIEPKDIVEFMLNNKMINCRIQLQAHKFIWPPDMRGV